MFIMWFYEATLNKQMLHYFKYLRTTCIKQLWADGLVGIFKRFLTLFVPQQKLTLFKDYVITKQMV